MRLVLITLGWVIGIILSAQFQTIFWMLGIPASIILSVVLYRFKRSAMWWGIVALAFMLGGLRYSFVPRTSDVAFFNGSNGTIEGIVIAEPDVRDDRIQLRVEASTIFANNQTYVVNGVVLVEASTLSDVQYGDKVRATGSLITPAEWDTFSYADFLGREGVFTIMPYAAVEVTDSGHGIPFFATLISLKQSVHERIVSSLPEPQAGLLTGILLGNERGISPELSDDFSRVGASHIIAISGFNMVIVSGIVMRFFGVIFRERQWLAVCMGIIVIAVYTLFVGANNAVLRAAFMSVMLVIAPLFKRKTYVPASLAFTTLVLSFLSPTVLWDVSFQLSFLAVLGLSLFADPLSRYFHTLLTRWLPYKHAQLFHAFLNEPLIVSIAAQITTLPLIILYFGRLSVVSLPVNVLIVPVQSILLIVAMVAVGISFVVPAIGGVIFWGDMVFLSWSIEIVRAFARLDFADIGVSIDGRLIGGYYALLIGGAMVTATRPPLWLRLEQFLRKQVVLVAIVTTGIISTILMVGVFLSRPDGQLHIWMLDMGHNNAVLIQSPNGAHILVDGGRFPSRLLTALGDRMPYYDREIEMLAITHPDEFDIGALNSVLERYSVGVALLNGHPNLSETVQEIESRLADVPTVTVRAGYSIQLDDGLLVEVLHPQAEPVLSDDLNDHVMVLRLNYGEVSVLLTSDLNREGQMAMLENGYHPLASVMQIPQHATLLALDGEFLAQVQPQVALIQIDRANRRGDPDDDTIANLGDIPIFRTDEIGDIHLWTDGQSLWIAGED